MAMKSNQSLLRLLDKAYSNQARQAFRNQTDQLIAFAAVAVAYAVRSSWHPTQTVSNKLRKDLADISALLNIDPTAHQTFVIHVRRMMMKICNHSSNDDKITDIVSSADEITAHNNLLHYLNSRKIFTASHMRTWASQNGIEPLALRMK